MAAHTCGVVCGEFLHITYKCVRSMSLERTSAATSSSTTTQHPETTLQSPHVSFALATSTPVSTSNISSAQLSAPLASNMAFLATPPEQPRQITYQVSTPSISDITSIVQPFCGNCAEQESADQWLYSFNTYTTFKRMDDTARLGLFKLLMKGQTLIWLRTQPPEMTQSYQLLRAAFQNDIP